jgi:hypothetical protein
MTTDDLQLLREFRAEMPAPGEATRRRIYAYATSQPTATPDGRGRPNPGLLPRDQRRRPRSAGLTQESVRRHFIVQLRQSARANMRLALAVLIALCHGDREALGLLRRFVRRVRPTVVPRP